MSKLSELQQVFRKLLPLVVITISGVAILPVSNSANAQTRLTRAVIQDLRNLVQLMPQRQPKRRAQRSDAMTPGDGLSTGRLSLADLRFNDGSLTRVGEQAVFKFLPQTRNFTLNNGTVLLLIPPGRGRTNIRTPSAAAAIRGSALFVRYDKATDTTVVGALTNSGIEVFDKDASKSQVLKAGQMMVVVKGKFQGLYDFDLRTFYETSDLVRGLDLTRQNPNATSDPALDSVRAETSEALAKQSPISGPGTIKDPSFIKLSTTPEETSNTSDTSDTSNTVLDRESDKLDSILDNSQIQQNSNQRNNGNNSTTESGNNSEAPTNVPNPSVTLPQQQPGTVTTPTQPQTPVTPPSPPGTGIITTPQPQTPVTPPSPPGTGIITTPQPQTPVTPPSPPGTGIITTPQPQTPVTPPSPPGTGTVTTPIQPETPVTPPSPPGTGTVTTPIQPETPVTPPITKPETPVTPPITKPETPVTPPVIKPETPVTPPITKPETPVTPPITKPETPVTPPITKPETPVTPPISKPETPVTPPITKPETPVTPRPPSDATTDPSTRPST